MPSQNIFCIASSSEIAILYMRCFLHATTRDDKHWPEANWRELIGLVGKHRLALIKLPRAPLHEEARAKTIWPKAFDYVDVKLPRMSLEEVARVLAGKICRTG